MTLVALCGPAGAGKTTLAELLTAERGYTHVRAVTTRAPRPGDDGHYQYLSKRQFDRILRAGQLAIESEYAGQMYGIEESALSNALSPATLLVATVTTDAALKLKVAPKYASAVTTIFLDAPDEELDRRITNRNDLAARREARSLERTHGSSCDLVLTGADPGRAASLVDFVSRRVGAGGVLPGRVIKLYLEAGLLLAQGDIGCVQGASYDLRLGDEYYYGGQIMSLSDKKPVLLIEPYDYAIVTSRERANFPRDICGSFDLSVGLFSQGVILSNGPQVDPGFRGTLFCLLFNTSSSPVLMKRGQHYATLVLHRLLEPADPYQGARQDKNSIVDYLPANAARGAINDLKKEMEALRRQSLTLQNIFLTAVAIMVAVIAMLVAR